LRGSRFDSIKPLLEAQSYISEVTWTDSFPAPSWLDFSNFRNRYQPNVNLAIQQAEVVNVKISLEPWLTIPNVIQHNRPVIARSNRYYNSMFPWRSLLSKFINPKFVGHTLEHRLFTASYLPVEYQETKDILALAQVIAGASVLISNQTCAWWIGAGAGIPVIQESYLNDLNSVINRPNLLYSRSAREINELLDLCTSTSSAFPAPKCVTELAGIGGLTLTAQSRSG
jgi:hypothetical protein